MSPVVVLVGVPGSGKSTVGSLLAERLGLSFRDTDQDVELGVGKAVADIFVDSGEVAFRAMEKVAVADALATHDGVLALGGGAVLDDGTRALLAGRPTVWLRVGASAGARRVGLDVPRPVLLGNVRGRLGVLVSERSPLYAEVARFAVDTDEMTPAEVAEVIVTELRLEGSA